MLKKLTMVAIFASLTMFAMSCRSDEDICNDSCEAGNACEGEVPTDCAEVCNKLSTIAEAAACGSEYSGIVDCGSDLDACDPGVDKCIGAMDAWNACLAPYCAANPTACSSGN